jgi:tetratricopeptide (TPR) repeat protein
MDGCKGIERERQECWRFWSYRKEIKMKRIYNVVLGLAISCLLFSSCVRKFNPAHLSSTQGNAFDSAASEYVYIEAMKQKLLGNGGDAIKLFEQCLKSDPANDAAYFQISQILIGSGDINNGKKYGLKAFNLNPENFWYTIMLAGTYYQEKTLTVLLYFMKKPLRDSLKRKTCK